jgi:hypothetical protein
MADRRNAVADDRRRDLRFLRIGRGIDRGEQGGPRDPGLRIRLDNAGDGGRDAKIRRIGLLHQVGQLGGMKRLPPIEGWGGGIRRTVCSPIGTRHLERGVETVLRQDARTQQRQQNHCGDGARQTPMSPLAAHDRASP